MRWSYLNQDRKGGCEMNEPAGTMFQAVGTAGAEVMSRSDVLEGQSGAICLNGEVGSGVGCMAAHWASEAT